MSTNSLVSVLKPGVRTEHFF
ncbi:unnamed protein product, partial [Allacma fusca]